MTNSSNSGQSLDAGNLAELRMRLEAERDRLRDAIELEHQEEGADDVHDALEHEAEDFGEQGQDITLQDEHFALEANDQRTLDQIERALSRMDEGTYGTSEVTGEPIPLERLQALPWATTNVGDRQENPIDGPYV